KYIFCEKPMANSIEDAENMIKICDKSGVRLGINHQQRYMDCYKRLKEIIDSDKLQGLETFAVIGANFGLAMNGSHYLELGIILFNESYQKISAFLQESPVRNPRGDKFKDPGGIITCITKSGKKFIISAGVNEGCGISMILSCKYGNVYYRPLVGKTLISYRKEEDREYPSTRYGLPPVVEEIDMPQDDIIESTKRVLHALLSEEKEINVLTTDSMEVIKTLIAAYVSTENDGMIVELTGKRLPYSRTFPWP
ncbi:MAG: Gfo/Idh/MocA family oxidoreductase, partial [Acidobacteria bacterium]|nr:Gfo/Idh/MocA family oxidoreductase [Acidobacteriota bacterium]